MTTETQHEPERITYDEVIRTLGITKKMLWRLLNQHDIEVDWNDKYRKAPTRQQAITVAEALRKEKEEDRDLLQQEIDWINKWIEGQRSVLAGEGDQP